MRRTKKILCCFLLLLMTVFLYAGGGRQSDPAGGNAPTRETFNPASFPAPPANYTIRILTISFDGDIIQSDHPSVSRLQEHTGFGIRLEYVLNANYAEQMYTRIAGGDLPGLVVITANTGPIVTAAQGGAFWDITDVYDMYPELARADRNVLNNISIGGRIFGIQRERVIGRAGMIYRTDWLQNLGLSVPRTLDELYNVLHAFTYNDPDRNGINDTIGMAWTGTWMGPFNDLAVMHGAPNKFGIQDGRLVPWFEYPEFFEAMVYSKRLYDEGILNRDFAALPSPEWALVIGTGRAGWHIDVADEANRTAARLRDNGLMTQEAWERGELVGVMGSVANSRGQMFSRPTTGHAGYVAISTSGARTLQDLHYHLTFMNYLNDPVGVNLLNWGTEGINHRRNPDGTLSSIAAAEIPNGWHITAGWNQFRMLEHNSFIMSPNAYQARHLVVYQENIAIAVHDPTLPLAMMAPTWIQRSSSLDQIIDDAVINFILGRIDQAGFRAQIARWYNEGGQTALAELQAAYDASR